MARVNSWRNCNAAATSARNCSCRVITIKRIILLVMFCSSVFRK